MGGTWDASGQSRYSPSTELAGTGRVADDLHLVAHHQSSGKPLLQPRTLGIGLAGGLLAELMLLGAIGLGPQGIVITARVNPPDEVQRQVLSTLASEGERHPTRDWLLFLGRSVGPAITRRLASAGFLTQLPAKGLRRRERWAPADPTWALARLVRIRAALDPTRPPTEYDATLTGLADACGLGFRIAAETRSGHGRTVAEATTYLKPALRELIAETQAAIDSSLLSHRA